MYSVVLAATVLTWTADAKNRLTGVALVLDEGGSGEAALTASLLSSILTDVAFLKAQVASLQTDKIASDAKIATLEAGKNTSDAVISGLQNLVAGYQTLVDSKQDVLSVSNRLDAAFIGGGSVANIEFNRLNGTSSNIQTQLDAQSAGGTKTGLLDFASTGSLKVPVGSTLPPCNSENQGLLYLLSDSESLQVCRCTNILFSRCLSYGWG